ncbi:MAG: site-specific integrase [Magnetospirillum gryphiswaldense]|nr:site-specific integrase [Magnetospirillum gryphiswaldense]
MATFVKRSGAWQVKIRRKGYPPVSRTFDTKAQGERWARDVESEMDCGTYVDRSEAERTTLHEALERYEREVTPKKKGARQEKSRIAKWKRDALALRSLASIRGADMAAWRDRTLNDGASPTTIRNDMALISHLFTIAAKEWGLESLSNPVQKITIPSPARARDRRLVGDEETRLLTAADSLSNPWMRPLIVLALETGMRQGELLALTWDCLDLSRRVAALADTKNGESRAVPLSTRAASTLRDLSRCLDGRVFPLTQDQVTYFFTRSTEKAEIKDLRFHDLRHEATSRLFERGLNAMEAAAVTGHKTLQMLKRYTHLRAEDLAAKLG